MVEINNLTKSKVDGKFIKRVVGIVLEGEGKQEGDVSLAIVGQNRIRELNRRYRGRNRATDVLSFLEPKEIVICLREVKKNAKRFGQDLKRELAKVLIHGTLHVLGYGHQRRQEEYYLNKAIKDEN